MNGRSGGRISHGPTLPGKKSLLSRYVPSRGAITFWECSRPIMVRPVAGIQGQAVLGQAASGLGRSRHCIAALQVAWGCFFSGSPPGTVTLTGEPSAGARCNTAGTAPFSNHRERTLNASVHGFRDSANTAVISIMKILSRVAVSLAQLRRREPHCSFPKRASIRRAWLISAWTFAARSQSRAGGPATCWRANAFIELPYPPSPDSPGVWTARHDISSIAVAALPNQTLSISCN